MTVLAALALVAASLTVGAAVCCRDRRWSWTAPAVGLAVLITLASLAVRLPGHGSVAAGTIALALMASALSLLRRRVDLRPALAGLPAGVLVLGLSLLPFLANHHLGGLGASVDDDLAVHLQQADILRHATIAHPALGAHYPLGPHALVAALAQGTGIGVETAFTGLLVAVPVLLALTALAGFDGLPWPGRTVGAVLVGTPYLVASYVVQGAFKEPLLAVLFLGGMLTLRDVVKQHGPDRRQAAALLVIAAAAVADFGVAGLAWPAAGLGALALLEYRPGDGRSWRDVLPRPHPAVLVGALAAVVLIVLVAQPLEFFRSGSGRFLAQRGAGGNFVGQLSPLQALGIWPAQDFRFPAARPWLTPGVAFAVVVTLYGILWCWRRREHALLAAALGGVAVYVVARPFTLAYFSGKALVIVSPALVMIGVRALADGSAPVGRAVRTGALALFALLALYSSVLALRSAHVRPQGRGPDVAAFRSIVGGASTLNLGRSNWLVWDLRGSRAAGFQLYNAPSAPHLRAQPGKAAGDSTAAVDFDSLPAAALDRYRYVIAGRSAYASAPAANFQAIARTRWHVLLRRRGPTPRRAILNEGGAPGAILDCADAGARRLSRRPGVAFVRPAPVVGSARRWRRPDGGPGPAGVVTAGGSLAQTLSLPRGRWELSLRYYSDVPLSVRIGSAVRRLPAYIDDASSFLAFGRVTTGGGRVVVAVRVADRRFPDVLRRATLGTVVATRTDDRGRTVPIARACGRYVDWYRLTPGRSPN